MTTYELLLLCSSLQGVRTCILLCLVLRFATFAAFGKLGYPPPAACSMPQHRKIFLGTVGACRCCLRPLHMLPQALPTGIGRCIGMCCLKAPSPHALACAVPAWNKASGSGLRGSSSSGFGRPNSWWGIQPASTVAGHSLVGNPPPPRSGWVGAEVGGGGGLLFLGVLGLRRVFGLTVRNKGPCALAVVHGPDAICSGLLLFPVVYSNSFLLFPLCLLPPCHSLTYVLVWLRSAMILRPSGNTRTHKSVMIGQRIGGFPRTIWCQYSRRPYLSLKGTCLPHHLLHWIPQFQPAPPFAHFPLAPKT